ncbi:CDP-alcohol phosphatidyltransferase family protein [Herbiconiux sp. VKM Ac-2851]|uniref:CDP-alcohol phosphatidyltransferase family protein n=1 Tax=Herbiconiux sp. VKM Ac-2851 TaxID=2739025 RepID=UPI0015644CD2|nr:CDP-alcohol phosphatidyltransferase family protein [Herbiconiux sp. VKM Ac-2851]NQX37146.1 CDP-alcohol phosphatidyltransferase family protein [Herbiconiux sp. VKM Ac-2851]
MSAAQSVWPGGRWVTVPNIVTVLRLIVFAPLFVILLLVVQSPLWALIVLIVLGATDWIDGWIARRFQQVSDVGRVLDPVADRVSQIVVATAMVIAGLLPLWMAVVVVAADVLLGATIVLKRTGVLPVSWMGRIRTALLMVGLPAVLAAAAIDPNNVLLRTAALCVLGVGVLLHAAADGAYVMRILAGTIQNQTDAHPDGRPTAGQELRR